MPAKDSRDNGPVKEEGQPAQGSGVSQHRGSGASNGKGAADGQCKQPRTNRGSDVPNNRGAHEEAFHWGAGRPGRPATLLAAWGTDTSNNKGARAGKGPHRTADWDARGHVSRGLSPGLSPGLSRESAGSR